MIFFGGAPRVIDDVRKNPGLLKLDLYCRGVRLHDSCRLAEDGGREIMRTRAGLGSGLEVVLPGGLYTNIPVVEEFAARSPYELRREGDGHYGLWREDGPVAPVALSPRPAWYDRATSSGTRMSRVGTLQGTYLAIYPSRVCDYWKESPRANCRFCSVGLNLGRDDAEEKKVQDVLETVGAAVEENRISYVDFNTGHYEGDSYLDLLEPFIRAVKRRYGLLIGIQTPPHHDLARYRELKKIGVNRVSFCFELWDRERFREVCPGKHRQYGLERYLAAIEYCAKIFHTTNGEIVAGLEPPEKSIEAIDWITAVGAVPTVCVFRPLIGHRLRGDGPAAHRGAGPGVPPALRGLHGTWADDRGSSQHQGLAGDPARGGPLVRGQWPPLPGDTPETRLPAAGLPVRAETEADLNPVTRHIRRSSPRCVKDRSPC